MLILVHFVLYIDGIFPWASSAFVIQGIHTTHNYRDLDRGEGAALHAHLFEETIDWSEPLRKQNDKKVPFIEKRSSF